MAEVDKGSGNRNFCLRLPMCVLGTYTHSAVFVVFECENGGDW